MSEEGTLLKPLRLWVDRSADRLWVRLTSVWLLASASASALGPVLVALAVFVSSTSTLLGSYAFGPLSGLAVATIVASTSTAMTLLAYARISRRALRVLWPLFCFIAYGFALFMCRPPRIAGIQNLLVTLTFVSVAASVAAFTRRDALYARWIQRSISVSLMLLTLAYLASSTGTPLRLVGGRVFAVASLSGVSIHLAQARYGSTWSLIAAAIVLGLVFASLSRMALMASLIMVAVSQFRPRSRMRWFTIALWVGVCGVGIGIAVTSVEALRSRFFEGDLSMHIGGVAINAMGRTRMWSVTWQSFLEAPVFGKGPGAAHYAVRAALPNLDHPHNDYLRILHDYGVAGSLLWVVGHASLLRATAKSWRQSDRARQPQASYHLAGLLALVALSMIMVSDNPLAYVFVMGPIGGVAGISLGLSRPGRLLPGSTSARQSTGGCAGTRAEDA